MHLASTVDHEWAAFFVLQSVATGSRGWHIAYTSRGLHILGGGDSIDLVVMGQCILISLCIHRQSVRFGNIYSIY